MTDVGMLKKMFNNALKVATFEKIGEERDPRLIYILFTEIFIQSEY